MNDANERYRDGLIASEQKAQGEFDKTVQALSGGALGVSFAFVKQFLGTSQPSGTGWLIAAWVAWTTSLALVLTSHYFSTLALRQTIIQLDSQRLRRERPGGWYDTAVVVLNPASGAAFVLGLVFVGIFVFRNM